MKFIVKPVDTEPLLQFYLEEDDGDVVLCANDIRNGYTYSILTIYAGGSAILHGGLDEDLGLQLQEEGALAISGVD